MARAVDGFIEAQLSASLENLQAVYADQSYRSAIATAGELMVDCLKNDHKLLFAGNGGSAADAQHIAGEFVSRFNYNRPGLAAIALTTDTSIMTAIGNDYGYDYLFARQIEALARPGDVFVAISTSGNSKNVVAGIEAAKKKGITVIGMTGQSGGKMKELCDCCLCVPSPSTPKIQEAHLITYHLLCGYVEEQMFPDHKPT